MFRSVPDAGDRRGAFLQARIQARTAVQTLNQARVQLREAAQMLKEIADDLKRMTTRDAMVGRGSRPRPRVGRDDRMQQLRQH